MGGTGTAYLEIAADTARFLKALPHDELKGALLVVDATGVGDAVYEMVFVEMIKAGILGSWCAVTITAGSAVSLAGEARWQVAKARFVVILQVLLGDDALQIARAVRSQNAARMNLALSP